MEGSTQTGSTDAYFAKVKARLDAAGYSWLESSPSFRAVATRKSFQLTKFGFWEDFMVFRDFQQLDRASLDAFMKEATSFVFQNRRVKLPRGLFAGVTTYGIALAQSVDVATAAAVRNETPPKHWAAMEIPVVYEPANRIHYFERTPVWGAAYHRGLRKKIEALLSP